MALNSFLPFLQQASQFLPVLGSVFPANTKVGKAGRSYAAQMFGHELTGAQREANAFTMSMQKDAQAYNAEQAQINRDYQTQMSNTAYQRQVADMQAAGVNPALAMSPNAGASTPSGGAASAGAGASVSPYGGNLMDVIMQMKQLEIQRKLADAEIALKESQANKTNAEIPWIDRLNAIAEEKGTVDIENARQAKHNMEADYDLKIKQAKNEDERTLLIKADAALKRANENQITVMLEYEKAYMSAKTDTERAQCNLARLQYMYNQKLWTDDYIDSIARLAKANADDAEISKEIDEATRDILKGNWIDMENMSKGEKALAKILNLFMAVNAASKR